MPIESASPNNNRKLRTEIASKSLSYIFALTVGLILVALTFPHWALVGGWPPGAPPKPDFGKDIVGQVYYFAQQWRLSSFSTFLVDRKLDAPWGASIAFSDSIPLFAVFAKLLRPILPPFDQAITLYQVFAWTMQPVAAVFALRSAGQRRIIPAIAVAVMASSMPTFLFRLWHAALSGHFFLLFMLGLYFRIIDGRKLSLAFACGLQILLLFVHPYLMFIATALLFAAPLTLIWRRDRRWLKTTAVCIVSSAAVFFIGQVFGYWGAPSDGGFGYYSMNLLGPFWPTFSTLIPGIPFAPADGTGGQAEGYQYLGVGLFILLAVSAFGWRYWYQAIRRHQGLAVACLGFSALSVTNLVYFRHTLIIHIPFPSLILAQIRGSGRLFWPVSYLMLIGSIVVICRRFPRAGSVIILFASLAELKDAEQLRRMDHDQLTLPTAYSFDDKILTPILSHYQRLTVLPTFPCNGGGTPANEDIVWLASRTLMRVNSIYTARDAHPRSCFPTEGIESRTASDEIRIILPGFLQSVALIPNYQDDCRLFGLYVLCTRQANYLNNFPRYPVRPIPTSVSLPMVPSSPGADTLLAGWSAPLPTGGVWSVSTTSLLGGKLSPVPSGDVDVKITASAMPEAGLFGVASIKRLVSVWSAGHHIGDWSISPTPSNFEATIPANAVDSAGLTILELRTTKLASLLDLGFRADPRRFGILLRSVTFAPRKSSVP